MLTSVIQIFQLEKTPMMGSIDSPDCVKRQLAFKSLEDNLKHKTFCELFPDTVVEIKEAIKRHEEFIKAENASLAANGIHDDPDDVDEMQYIPLHRRLFPSTEFAITNICIIFGFVVFGFVIEYVIKSVSVD